jgi:hypothetical protein
MTEGKGKHDNACFYFEEGSIFRFLCCEVPHVSNILVMGQSNGSFRGFLTQSPGKESSLENT